MNIEFTREEVQNLMTLLDAAVRAQGLTASQVALPLAVKLQQALNAPEEESAST